MTKNDSSAYKDTIKKFKELFTNKITKLNGKRIVFFNAKEVLEILVWYKGVIYYHKEKEEYWIFIDESLSKTEQRIVYYYLLTAVLQGITTPLLFKEDFLNPYKIMKEGYPDSTFLITVNALVDNKLLKKANEELFGNIKEIADIFKVPEWVIACRMFDVWILKE